MFEAADHSTPGELDPDLRRMLAELAATGSELGRLPIAAERTRFRAHWRALSGPTPNDVAIKQLQVPGGEGATLAARLYIPAGTPNPAPGMVYFHGGGGVVGDLDAYEPNCAAFAKLAGIRLLSVDYRLAPEHPFPAGHLDAVAALAWAAGHCESLGFDPAQLMIGGDSQGATMSAYAASQQVTKIKLRLQMLIYPGFSLDPAISESVMEGYLLDRASIVFFMTHGGAVGHPQAADFQPALLPVAGLPPTLMVTAGFDPAAPPAFGYATRLVAAGVPVYHHHYRGLIHGFFNMGHVSPACAQAAAEIAALIGATLSLPHSAA